MKQNFTCRYMGTVRKAVLFLYLNLQNNNNLTTLKETTYETEEQDLYSYA